MESLQPGLYPENELASPPLPQPIRKPSVVSSIDGTDDDYEPFVCPSKLGGCNSRTKHRKHESYHLSGSVYLITSAGKTLNLPVPSGSPADPLNWTAWKRSGAIIAIACFWTASLTVVQAASLLHRDIFSEFKGQVRRLFCCSCIKSDHNRVECDATQQGFTRQCPYIVRGSWRTALGTFVLGHGATPCLPVCNVDDASRYNLCWLYSLLLANPCVLLHHQSWPRVLSNIRTSPVSKDAPIKLIVIGIPHDHRHDFHSSAS